MMNISYKFIITFLVVSLCALTAQAKKEKELTCFEKAQIGLCVINPKVKTDCEKVCDMKYQTYYLTDDKADTLLEMNITSSTGQSIEMDDLEGYVTIFIPIPKNCNKSPAVKPNEMFNFVQRLQKKYKYGLKVVVFPFEHPKVNYKDQDCTRFDDEMKKKDTKRSFQISEQIDMYGPNIHPMFKFLMDEMEIDKFFLNTLNYYIFNPDMDRFHVHFGKSLADVGDHLNVIIKTTLGKR